MILLTGHKRKAPLPGWGTALFLLVFEKVKRRRSGLVHGVVRSLVVGQNGLDTHVLQLLLELIEGIEAFDAHDILVELFRHIGVDLAHDVGVLSGDLRAEIQLRQDHGSVGGGPQGGGFFLLRQGLHLQEHFGVFHNGHLGDNAAGYSRALAKDLAEFGIRVNMVSPGTIDTPFHAATDRKLVESWKDSILMKRLGDPREVADVIEFLASDKASFLTGEVIQINGGQAFI